MTLDNSIHLTPVLYMDDPYSFNFYCGLVGIGLFVIGYVAVYFFFIKTYPEEQEQYYLTASNEKFYCEYAATVHKFNDMRVLRFLIPDKFQNHALGADMETIELFFDDGNGDLARMAGIYEAMIFYPLGSLKRKGEFDIAVKEDSAMNRMLHNQKPGFPMKVQGPKGRFKYLGYGQFYE